MSGKLCPVWNVFSGPAMRKTITVPAERPLATSPAATGTDVVGQTYRGSETSSKTSPTVRPVSQGTRVYRSGGAVQVSAVETRFPRQASAKWTAIDRCRVVPRRTAAQQSGAQVCRRVWPRCPGCFGEFRLTSCVTTLPATPMTRPAVTSNKANGQPSSDALTRMESTSVCGVLIRNRTEAPSLATLLRRPTPTEITLREHSGRRIPITVFKIAHRSRQQMFHEASHTEDIRKVFIERPASSTTQPVLPLTRLVCRNLRVVRAGA